MSGSIQQPDVLGNYLSNYRQAQEFGQQQQDRQFQQQRVQRQDERAEQEHDWADLQRKNEIVARTALNLNTPEAWAQHVPQVMQQLGFQGPPPPFSERENIINQAMSVKEQIQRKLDERKFALDERQTNAAIRASDAAAAASNRRGVGAGGIDNTTFDNMSSFRKEYTNATKDFGTVSDAYGRIKATSAAATPAGDLSMIYAYMKMLDPGSVVRESEFALAQNAKPLLDRLGISWDAVKSTWEGTKLQPQVRADFMKQAAALYQQQIQQKSALDAQFTNLAQRFGFDPTFVVTGRPGVPDEDAPPEAPPSFTRGGASVFSDPSAPQAFPRGQQQAQPAAPSVFDEADRIIGLR